MWVIELNPFFGATDDTLKFWSTITSLLKTSREKESQNFED